MSIFLPLYPAPHFKQTDKKRFEDTTHWVEFIIKKDNNGELTTLILEMCGYWGDHSRNVEKEK